jgi:hypothetical protein
MPTEQPDITLASTTETQAELDHATGPNWREHFDPAKAKADEEGKKNTTAEPSDKKDEKDETKTAPASEPGKAASKKEEDEEPLPKGVQKRLDRLTARLKEAEEQLRTRRGEPEKEKPEPAKAASSADPEPQLKDFKDWDQWNAAHNRWLVRDEQRQIQAKEAEREAQESAKEIYDAHLSRLDEARGTHDDFDDAIKGMPVFEFSSPQANQAFQMALVDSEFSGELMYHLAKHPEDMAKFANLSPQGVQRMLGRLEARLFPEGTSSVAARAKPVSRTPKPTTPVRGTTTAPSALDDPALVKDTDAWIQRRQAQLTSSRRH